MDMYTVNRDRPRTYIVPMECVMLVVCACACACVCTLVYVNITRALAFKTRSLGEAESKLRAAQEALRNAECALVCRKDELNHAHRSVAESHERLAARERENYTLRREIVDLNARVRILRVIGEVFGAVRKAVVCVFGAVRKATTVTTSSTSLFLLDVRGHGVGDRTSYSPVLGDSHAFLGAAYTTGGRCNPTA